MELTVSRIRLGPDGDRSLEVKSLEVRRALPVPSLPPRILATFAIG